MNKLEEKNYLNQLFSFYKSLLTVNQQELFTAYYENDYSLAEIAESREITRSAVHDALSKTCKELYALEDKLHLLANQKKRQSLYTKLEDCVNSDGQKYLDDLKEME